MLNEKQSHYFSQFYLKTDESFAKKLSTEIALNFLIYSLRYSVYIVWKNHRLTFVKIKRLKKMRKKQVFREITHYFRQISKVPGDRWIWNKLRHYGKSESCTCIYSRSKGCN